MARETTMTDRLAEARLQTWRRLRGRAGAEYAVAVALLAIAYYVAAKIGLRLAYLNGAVTALWPPVGVGIAALVLYGPRLWPGVVIADLLVGDYSTPLGTVLGQTVGNTLEVVVAAVLLRRLFGSGVGLSRVAEVLGFVGCAMLGTLVSACFGPASLRLGNVISQHEVAEVWRTWWLSDLSGALVVTPVILTWANARPRLRRRQVLEAVALALVVVVLAEVPSQRDVPYVVFPALIWAALRFGPIGASTALLIVSSLTVWNTAHNAGPFVRASITDSLLSSQLFIATAALTSLVLAAVSAERGVAAGALRSSEERLRSILRSMAEGLIVSDARGVITDCNAAAERITGRPRDELVGRRAADVLGEAARAGAGDERAPGPVPTAVNGADPDAGVLLHLPRSDGTEAWVSLSSAPVLGPDGRPEGVVTTLSDITERRRAEERLVASERATRALAAEQTALRRVATLVAAEPPASTVFEQVTGEVARLLGTPSASVVRYDGDAGALVVGRFTDRPGDRITVGATLPVDPDTVTFAVRRSERPERIEGYDAAKGELAQRLRALGYRASVAAPVRVGGRLWGALIASARDPADLPEGSEQRLCDFADLIAQALANADAREQLAASRKRIVDAGDEERRRLERNLHDGAQQRLVALALRLRLIEAKVGRDPESALGDVAAAGHELAAALDDLRELARGIHPAVLTDRGLEAALTALADRSPVPVEISEVPATRLPPSVEAAVYYIAAEAITNVAKYARATHVRVAVREAPGRTLVEITDDGVGGADPRAGSGLRGLGDRVEALRGRLEITSPPGEGTRIEAAIPTGQH